jgi:hypothetical protein
MPAMLRRAWLAFVRRRRSALTTALELGGFALLTEAAWEVARPLGVATAGVFLVLIGYTLGGRR